MRKTTLGEGELKLLRWVAEHAPVSVAQVTEQYGQAHGLARTTLLTVLERLRKKGYLKRSKQDGVFCYRPSEPHTAQMRGIVGRFMEQSLGGSLEPFVAYLTEEASVTPHQLEQLRRMVQELEAREQAKDDKPTEAGNNTAPGKGRPK